MKSNSAFPWLYWNFENDALNRHFLDPFYLHTTLTTQADIIDWYDNNKGEIVVTIAYTNWLLSSMKDYNIGNGTGIQKRSKDFDRNNIMSTTKLTHFL